jgi:cysteine desulfurase/selenocysteine lyase
MMSSAVQGAKAAAKPFDLEKIRRDFPILQTKVHGKNLIYLDNAATTLKPKPVVDAISQYYLYGAANVHRGLHFLSEQATRQYEDTREKVRAFIGAGETAEVIFTSGTTASINLVAQSFGDAFVKAGDEILISHMEHHSNIVPWQMLCERKGAHLKVAPINDEGEISLPELAKLISDKTRLVAVVGISNSLGTINPIAEIAALAKQRDIPVLVDGAQLLAHRKIDVQALGIDFLAFSAHKLYGPTGVGVLYGRRALLEKMAPIAGGGDMIRSVTFEKTLYAPLPYKFEAGTPNIGGVIGLGAALDYLNAVGIDRIAAHEEELLQYGRQQLQKVPGLTLIGTAKNKASILAFTLDDVHPHDMGSLLDQEGVAIRAGHHCTQPVMARYKVPATARASLAFYNTKDDIDRLVAALLKVKELFK